MLRDHGWLRTQPELLLYTFLNRKSGRDAYELTVALPNNAAVKHAVHSAAVQFNTALT